MRPPPAPRSSSLLHPSSPRRPEPAPLPWLTSVKCGSLLGLFCRKPSPSTRLRRGPSSLQAQATAGSSAPAPCSAPCPDPRLGPSSAHLWLPAAGVVTGCGPSECLPLGTSSTISVCRGASMVRGPHRECWLAQRCTQKSAERTVPLMIPALGPTAQLPTGSRP